MPNVYKGQGSIADRVEFADITLAGDFSFCFKAKYDAIDPHPAPDNEGLASNDALDDYLVTDFDDTNFIIRFRIGGNTGISAAAAKVGLVTEGAWQTFIFTRNQATGRIDIFVDNVQGPTFTSADAQGDWVINQLFRRGTTADAWFDSIYDIQIYDGILDSAQRIDVGNDLLATPTAALPAVLRAWWRCQDSDTSTTTLDWSINGNDGTNVFADDDAWHVNDATAPKDYGIVPDPSGLVTVDAWYDASVRANIEIDIVLPSSITSIDAWYDPTNNTEITDSSGEVEFMEVVGGTIPILGQPDSNERPDINETLGPNNLQCLTFNRTNNETLTVPDNKISRSMPFECWFVIQADHITNTQQNFITDNAGDFSVFINSAGNLRANNGATGTWGAWPSDGLPHVVRVKVVSGANNSSITVDNGTPVDVTLDSVGDEVFNGLQLGGTGVSVNLTGKMGDVFISDDEMIAQEVLDMWDYMARWTTLTGLAGRVDKLINTILPATADLEQATAASQPSTGNPIGPNRLNALRLTEGTPDDQLEVVTGAITRVQTYEIWIAFRFDDPSTAANQYLFDSETVNRAFIRLGGTGLPVISAGTNITGTAVPDDDLPHIIRALYKQGSAGNLFLDGVSIITPGDVGAAALKTLSVGADKDIGDGMTGEIGEIIVSNRELNSREVTFMENYMSRWTTIAESGGSGVVLGSSIGISL